MLRDEDEVVDDMLECSDIFFDRYLFCINLLENNDEIKDISLLPEKLPHAQSKCKNHHSESRTVGQNNNNYPIIHGI